MPDRYVENNTCDYTAILKELNENYIRNSELNREDAQLFVKITNLNYYPIKFNIDEDGFNIEDNQNYAGREIAIGSKRQYFYKCFTINTSTRIVNINVDEFKTGWNDDKYLVFRNGLLLNKGTYRIAIPSFENTYNFKCIYSMINFVPGDRVDVFYIESEESFDDVPFNGNMYVNIQRQWCINDEQLLFKVPYPYPSYPRGEKMFICMNDEGEYLDNRDDYTTSYDGEYITLNERYGNMISYVNYLLFLFPYVMADWETEGGEDENQQSGNRTGVDLFQSYSILSKSSESTGIINFYPAFDKYNIDNKSMMLFANTTYIDQDRYKILNNSQIQLLLDTDKKHSSVAKYTMLIFSEQKVTDANMRKFNLRVEKVMATEDRQQIFYIPEIDVQKESFLGFLGSVSLDLHNRCTWKPEIHQIVMNSDEDYVLKGRPVYFIFYEAQDNHLIRDKEISFKKMMWDITDDGPNTIPKQLYEGSLKFDNTNLILFLNGTYLQPDRYTITHTDDGNNIISMNTPADTAILSNKTFTGIYLVSYTPNYQTEGDGAYKYTDLTEDHDWIWWDEMYAIPTVPPSQTADIDSGGGGVTLNAIPYSKFLFTDNGGDGTVDFEYEGSNLSKYIIDSGNINMNRNTWNDNTNGKGAISGNVELSGNINEDVTFPNGLVTEFYYTRRYLSTAVNHSYPFYFETTMKWFYSANDDIRVDLYFGSTSATNGALLDVYWGYPNGRYITSIALNAENRVSTNQPNQDSYHFNTNRNRIRDITIGIGITNTEIKAMFYDNSYGNKELVERTVYGYLPNPFYITAYMSDPPYWDDQLSVRVTHNFGKEPWIYPELARRYYNS